MKIRHLFALLSLAGEELVERPAPGAAPTAFRIWGAGQTDSDDGPVFFTKKSADRLIEEQTGRGRDYAIDFDHLSLQTDRPATSGRAAGWHRLEVRPDANGEPELWAVDVQWCEDVKAGLEEKPPRWKYFSPAFLTRVEGKGKEARDTREIASYLNLALCINPKTHELPALAAVTTQRTTKGTANMDPKKCQALLQAMIDSEEDGEKKEALTAAYKAAFPEAGDDDAPKKDEPKKDEPKKDAADGDEPKKDEPKKDEPKKDAVVEKEGDDDASKKAAQSIEATVKMAVAAQLKEQRAEALARQTIDAEIDAREDLAPALKEWAHSQPITVVRSFLDKAPKKMAQRKATATKGKDIEGAGLLEGAEREEMDRAMGVHAHTARMPERKEDGTFVVHTVRPSDFRAAQAQKGNG